MNSDGNKAFEIEVKMDDTDWIVLYEEDDWDKAQDLFVQCSYSFDRVRMDYARA